MEGLSVGNLFWWERADWTPFHTIIMWGLACGTAIAILALALAAYWARLYFGRQVSELCDFKFVLMYFF